MSVHQLFYVSSAAGFVTEITIDEILEKARDFNEKNGITGVLLFRAGIFLQLLEGEQDIIQALFNLIEKDKRHENVVKLFDTDGNQRLFEDWSMGYRKVEDLDVKFVNEILSWNKLIEASPGLDNKLILEVLSRFKTKVA